MSGFNKTYAVAFVVIAVAVGFTFWAFSSSLTQYVDIKTARQTNTPVQLRGFIVRDMTHKTSYDSTAHALKFWMKDKNAETMEVVYYGAKPDAFDNAPGTAALGSIHRDMDGIERFHASNLVIQCPSKYNDEKNVYTKTASN